MSSACRPLHVVGLISDVLCVLTLLWAQYCSDCVHDRDCTNGLRAGLCILSAVFKISLVWFVSETGMATCCGLSCISLLFEGGVLWGQKREIKVLRDELCPCL
ncbi:hypothetical protein V1264_008866 [Littorina saxatilis]|uniref:Uncharacterized protein n=1 Tax=Littorina saxatilis TaxID=31220 RepID=A0AAN9AQ79_9CAEN